jgi:hypothetical protein
LYGNGTALGRVDETLDALSEDFDVEVDQQSPRQACQPQIRQDLRIVDRRQLRHALHLDEHLVVHDEVCSEAARDPIALVRDRYLDLALKLDAAEGELISQTAVVRRFEQPGTKASMNANRTVQNLADERMGLIGQGLSETLCVRRF